MKLLPCRSCRAPIWFGRTEKGRRIPIDRDEVAGGNVVLVEAGDGSEEPAIRVGPGEMPVAYVSHFATCGSAARHRRGQR